MPDLSEAEFLKQYNPKDYDIPLVSVDVALFTLHDDRLQLLLVERAEHPHQGRWALPGGFVDQKKDADIDATAYRKLREKTGVTAPLLEQVCALGNARRDPRGWSVTLLYMALVPYVPTADFVRQVKDARWWPWDEIGTLSLAFDHQQLAQRARDRLKNKTAYSTLPLHVLQQPFTLSQLQLAFELLLDSSVEKKSFRRRILGAGLLEEVSEGSPAGGRGRPAALFIPAQGSQAHLFSRIFGDSQE